MKNNTDKEIKEIENLIGRSIFRSGYFRCSICNAVSNERIETEVGDYNPNISFVLDPKDHNHLICISCHEEIEGVRQDFEYQDEWDEFK